MILGRPAGGAYGYGRPMTVDTQARVEMSTLVNPIAAHDTVWIEAMTQIEIRDALKAGKTTALLFVGGMEDNGPYVTVSQHNDIVRAMCSMCSAYVAHA